MERTTGILLIITGIALAAGGTASASNGCIEISMTNAGTLGNIPSPGCYVLTSDITQALQINGIPSVSIDLNGFRIAPPSGPAIILASNVERFELRNGTLETYGAAAVDGSGVTSGRNHVYRGLRILAASGSGIRYDLADASLVNVRVENVVIDADSGVEVRAGGGNVVLENLRINRCEFTTSLKGAVEIMGAPAAASFHVSGLLVDVNGSIQNCVLTAGDNNMTAVVFYNTYSGILQCFGNSLTNSAITSSPNVYAFSAPGSGAIVVSDNTSSAKPSSASSPMSGAVRSLIAAADSGSVVGSNYDAASGQY